MAYFERAKKYTEGECRCVFPRGSFVTSLDDMPGWRGPWSCHLSWRMLTSGELWRKAAAHVHITEWRSGWRRLQQGSAVIHLRMFLWFRTMSSFLCVELSKSLMSCILISILFSYFRLFFLFSCFGLRRGRPSSFYLCLRWRKRCLLFSVAFLFFFTVFLR